MGTHLKEDEEYVFLSFSSFYHHNVYMSVVMVFVMVLLIWE
jgi:hypothetical protein